MMTRRRSLWLWLGALIVAALLGYFQRTTGPTYPISGRVVIGGEEVRYRLPRSHGGEGGLTVELVAPEDVTSGTLWWRRWPTGDPFRGLAMQREADGTRAEAVIPHQPPAGKVEYRLELTARGETLTIPRSETVVARFRGSVPAAVLIPHILSMFGGMLLATRALLGVVRKEHPRRLVVLSMTLLVLGGLVLGPIVQRFAFGAYWTGWPFGDDLTDNKTLVAVLAWLPATLLAMRGRRLKIAVIVGWVFMMGVFLIPHSLRGSQLDWEEVPTPAPGDRLSGHSSVL